MDSLVNQFTTAGKLRVGAPFLVVADAPAMAVARPDEHQIAHHAGRKNLAHLEKRRMVAMIETHPDTNAMLLRERNQFVNLMHGNARRFFNDDVFARANGRSGNLGERSINCRHDDRVHLRIGDG